MWIVYLDGDVYATFNTQQEATAFVPRHHLNGQGDVRIEHVPDWPYFAYQPIEPMPIADDEGGNRWMCLRAS